MYVTVSEYIICDSVDKPANETETIAPINFLAEHFRYYCFLFFFIYFGLLCASKQTKIARSLFLQTINFIFVSLLFACSIKTSGNKRIYKDEAEIKAKK